MSDTVIRKLKATATQLNMPLSGLVLTIGFVILMIYDLIVVLVTGTTSSVSQFLVANGFRSPLIVGGFFFLAGHLFAYMYEENGSLPQQTTATQRLRYSAQGVVGGLLIGYLVRSIVKL